jgi:hypothetical protein
MGKRRIKKGVVSLNNTIKDCEISKSNNLIAKGTWLTTKEKSQIGIRTIIGDHSS